MASSEHFSDSELACKHCGVNGVHPELLDALEMLRGKIGKPIIVNSAYRCEAHNAAVGGVPDSEHVRGIAADIAVSGMTAEQLYAEALTIPAFADGGIGVAPHQGYIHVDVRGDMARWAYDPAGKWCKWNLDLPMEAVG